MNLGVYTMLYSLTSSIVLSKKPDVSNTMYFASRLLHLVVISPYHSIPIPFIRWYRPSPYQLNSLTDGQTDSFLDTRILYFSIQSSFYLSTHSGCQQLSHNAAFHSHLVWLFHNTFAQRHCGLQMPPPFSTHLCFYMVAIWAPVVSLQNSLVSCYIILSSSLSPTI